MAGVWNAILRSRTVANINVLMKRGMLRNNSNVLKYLTGTNRCFSAKNDLLRCLDNEIKDEQLPSVPNIGDFEVSN